MFKIGDTVIYPGYGICKIKGMQNREQEIIYVIKPNKPIPGGFKILIAKDQIEKCGVHYPINKRKVSGVLDILEKEPNDLSEDSQRGFPAAKEKIQNGNLFDTAETLRDLEKCNEDRYSSIKNSLIESAKKELIEEISYVKKSSKEEVNKLIDKKLEQ